LAWGKESFDEFSCAVVLFFFAPKEERDVVLDRDGRGKGKRGVGDAAKEIVLFCADRFVKCFRDDYE